MKANTSPDRKVVPYTIATPCATALHEIPEFLSFIWHRVRASAGEPLSYKGEGMEVPWDRDKPLGEAIRLAAARETKRATRRVRNSPRRYVFKSGTISRSVSSPYQADTTRSQYDGSWRRDNIFYYLILSQSVPSRPYSDAKPPVS